MPWGPGRAAHVPGEGPDPFAIHEVLRRNGIETRLIDPHPKPLNPFAGRNTLLQSLDPWRAIRVLLRERRADLVVCVFEGPALPLLLLRKLARYKVPIALWDLGLTEHWRLRERVLGLVVPRADAIMVLGESQPPYIRRRWRVKASPEVIHHHIDAEFFRPAPLNPAGPVLSVGEDVGRDFRALNEAVRGLDVEVVAKTRSKRAEFGADLSPNVTILDGWMSYRALRDLYARSRMVVVPLTDTPNASGVSTILEAMAMGRPLVVSDAPSIRDYIIPGETCLVVPCGDVAALRAAILRLMNEPDTAARLAAKGRQLLEARFADPVFAENLARVFRRIVQAHARG